MALPGVDIQADLNEPLDLLPDGSVEAVHCRHLLEHIDRLLHLLDELHRVVRPGGEIDIRVPHFSNPYGYSDPTHVRFFGLYSFFTFPRRSTSRTARCHRFTADAGSGCGTSTSG